MRARKRNPFYGQGLDKRQARRARRRRGRRVAQVAMLAGSAGFHLTDWQKHVVASLDGRPPRGPMVGAMVRTHPQGWAPPVRSYLFGLNTLSILELESEIERHRAYERHAAIAEVRREIGRRA